MSGDEVLALAAAAERNTRHPLADALVAAAEARGEAGRRECAEIMECMPLHMPGIGL